MDERVQVLIVVDDHALRSASGIAGQILEREADFEVVGEADDVSARRIDAALAPPTRTSS